MKVALTASHGFIGSHASAYFQKRGDQVIALERDFAKVDFKRLEGCDLFLHLSGENLAGRWTQRKKERIVSSRVERTRELVSYLLELQSPPSLFLSASAVGYYGDRGEERLTEESPPGSGFLPELVQAWERAALEIEKRGVRCALLRFGVVLGDGGALARMRGPFLWGLGGKIGDGRQWVSWIAMEDLLRAIVHIAEKSELHGPFNLVAPTPVRNYELVSLFAKKLHRPARLVLPASLLRLFYGEGADLYLSSCYALPERLEKSGFHFHFSTLSDFFA